MPDDYSSSLNLPKTDFPMRANLAVRELEILEAWNDMDLYNMRLKQNQGKPTYILHDGPPFANGDIHTGHTLNKILKDIVIKSKSMSGFFTPYVPGWDTHGLPIERQAIKKLKISKDKADAGEFRKVCANFAMKYVNAQREQFKRLGVLADWDNPYLTLDPKFEAQQIRIFGEMVAKKYIYRGLKPVYWCTECETALAEAEIEYTDHQVDSIFVKFPIVNVPERCKGINLDKANIVIWTTTTWTLPGNVAIAVGPHFDYALVEVNGEKLIMAEKLVESVMQTARLSDYRIVESFTGADLEGMTCAHPFLDRNSTVILADLVTLESGTGCVHIAPGHGIEDYLACRDYPDIPIVVPIDGKGVMNELAGPFEGQYYEKANKTIKQHLEDTHFLLAVQPLVHQYPHCWRCQNPIVFRATEQWFASVDELKHQALAEIKKVEWIPKWGEERISKMIADRTDWCISRQRLWGVPIPIFYCEKCNEPIMEQEIINHVAEIFEKHGSNSWFELDANELMPNEYKCKCGNTAFRKEMDTMDVWFDSGTSHSGVLELRPGLNSPADMYLEGNDQYRGWFQSSLLTSISHTGKAPYKTVLTHGFVVDSEGKKMSKSLGNGIDPNDIIKQYGADMLRLWVASSDYRTDVKISLDIMKQLSEIYRKIRNTARFMLGNLYDFTPGKDSVPVESLTELDLYALMKLHALIEKTRESFEIYDYHVIYQAVHNFCVVDMSSFYLDIIKDRLYTELKNHPTRRSAQTVMYEVLDALVRILAPLISFTADEIWSYIPKSDDIRAKSVHLSTFPSVNTDYFSTEFEEKWNKIFTIKEDVSKALEIARNDKLIGNSLEAEITLFSTGKLYTFTRDLEDQLEHILIVSKVNLIEGAPQDEAYQSLNFEELHIKVGKFDGKKCPRCWIYHNNKEDLCERCVRVMKDLTHTS